VWPLCGSGGEGGSRVPLAFGWEVPVSIQRSASGSGKERGTRHGARDDVILPWGFGHLSPLRLVGVYVGR
jgi:hypothetical protein